jgi:hypothetical protein
MQACAVADNSGMATDTLLIVGPGGIGKSPLDKLIKPGRRTHRPYRLRREGPRDKDDVLYAHPRLRDGLYVTYQRLGLTCFSESVHWFPQANTLFFRVRGKWQLLFLEAVPAGIVKAEIFAPAIPTIFDSPQVRRFFGPRLDDHPASGRAARHAQRRWSHPGEDTAQLREARRLA